MLVALPERVVFKKQNLNTYVYLTQSVEYDKNKKRSSPKRILIGKLAENNMLEPNDNYFSIYGEELREAPARSDAVCVGSQIVVSSIAEQVGLKELLKSVFDNDYTKILDLATYMVFSESNAYTYFEEYEFNHHIFTNKQFSDSLISKFLQDLSFRKMDLFISSWVKIHEADKIYIAYDSTNMNCKAGELELVEYGHAKDNSDLPQINVSIGYDQTNSTPLFYEMYPGSVIDNSECQKMVDRAIRYGCKNVSFILDRGYFSLKNIKYFESNGYNYCLMTKGNSKFLNEVMKQYSASVKNGYDYFLPEFDIYGITAKVKLFQTDKIQYVHLYYDGVAAEQSKAMINKEFFTRDRQLDDFVYKKIERRENLRSYEKYYHLNFDDYGYFQSYSRKDNVIKKELDKCGYFALITSEEMSAEDALKIYRDRDAVEKIFRMDKTYLGSDVFRVHTNERVESKVFISFIALIIRNHIYHAMKPLYAKNKSEFSVPKVLREIQKLSVTKLSDNKYHLRYNVTGKQKRILNQLNISCSEYEKQAKSIAEALR